MKSTTRTRDAILDSACGIAALSLFLVGSATESGAQTQKTAPPAPRFEVVSLKYAGSPMEAGTRMPGGGLMIPMRAMQYKGVRLSGETTIWQIVRFACANLVTPYRQEPDGGEVGIELYQIEAMAPAGTTLDGARAMLRTALAERLGFKYHIAERETPVYSLQRGNGALKLIPSTGPDPAGLHRGEVWLFKTNSAPIASFARFLSSVARRDVIDKTGIQGNYQFNVDWMRYLQEEGPGAGPDLAISGAKSLGLKLAPGKEMQKVLVVDHVNKMPTPN